MNLQFHLIFIYSENVGGLSVGRLCLYEILNRVEVEIKNPQLIEGGFVFIERRVQDLNLCARINGRRISNPLHYRSANSPFAERTGFEPATP